MVDAARVAITREHRLACPVTADDLGEFPGGDLHLLAIREETWRCPAFRIATQQLHEAQTPSSSLQSESRQLQHLLARACVVEALAVRGMDAGRVSPNTANVVYSGLGAPRMCLDPSLMDQIGGARVSFTHDGGVSFVCLQVSAQQDGLGIDAVFLPRLRRPSTSAKLGRLYSRLGGDPNDDGTDLGLSVARILAIKESASKALGTGLRLGLGIGRRGSLRLDQLHIQEPDTVVALGGAAVRLKFCVTVVEPFLIAVSSVYHSTHETVKPLEP